MTDRCDVVVVGGGPAGAAAAIALTRAGLEVVVLERSLFDRERIGETLPPEARVPLASLDVWHQFAQQAPDPSPSSISVWDRDDIDENHFIFNAYGNGWHLDRTGFDRMLVSVAAGCGARVHRGSRLTACVAGVSKSEVEYVRDGAVHKVRSGFVVDATGRASLLARHHGARRIRFDRLVGVVGVCTLASSTAPKDHRTLVEATSDGWWYSAWLPQSRLIAAYMTDADLIQEAPRGVGAFWRRHLDETVHTRSRVNGFVSQGPVRVVSACSETLDRLAGRTWVAIGDAAMSLDPLSSYGISSALQSGLLAARVIEGQLNGEPEAVEELSAWTRGIFDRYWRTHQLQYSRVQRWPDSPFWKRRAPGNEVQARVSAVFDDAQTA